MISPPETPGRSGRTKAGIALQRQIDRRGYTQITFARELGKSQPWISQSLLDDAERTLRRLALTEEDTFKRLLELLGWDYATLRAETGTLHDVLLPGEKPGEVSLATSDMSSGMKHIPVYDLLSAGPGNDGGTLIELADIPETWVGEHAGYDVSGDSMAPEIPDGARVIVRLQDYASPGNEIVCYVPDHGMLVKYLERISPAGEYVLTSYNPEYRPIWTNEITIYGVVVEVRKRRKVINGNHGPN